MYCQEPPESTPAESREALAETTRSCSRCGFCLAACPVYGQLRTELASPRGKVQLTRQIAQLQLPMGPEMKSILSACLLCGSCAAACPSGVPGDHIFSAMRWKAARRFGVGWKKKLIYQVLASSWKRHGSARIAAWVDRHFGGILRKGAANNALIAAMPAFNARPFAQTAARYYPATGQRRGKVLYFHGCATNYLYANVGNAVVDVLTTMGYDVEIPADQGCCGIPIFLSGARELALANIKDVIARFQPDDADAVIVDCATCGAALGKEYVPVLSALQADGQPISQGLIAKARQLASRTTDVTEFIARRFDAFPRQAAAGQRLRVTYHDPCHLSKGQGVGPSLRPLFRRINTIDYVEMTDANTCCGGGGSFQLDHPDISAAITQKKVANIRQTGADIVATGCPGCRLTIGSRLNGGHQHPVGVKHPIEILAAAINTGAKSAR